MQNKKQNGYTQNVNRGINPFCRLIINTLTIIKYTIRTIPYLTINPQHHLNNYVTNAATD